MLLRIQLENIGLFPTILTAFHNVLPMEQNCIYGRYFYGISKQSSPAASVILWWANTKRFKGEHQKRLIKRSKPKRVKNRSRLYGFAMAWAIFDQNDVFSHINSNDEGDILSWIQIQPGMQLVGLDLYGKHWKHQFTYWLFSNGFRLCIYSTLVHWTSVSTNIIYKKIASLAFNYYNYNLITLNQLFAHCSK